MELRRQLSFLRSSLPLVIATTLIGAISALLVSQVLPPTFEARVIVQVGGQTASGAGDDLNALQVSQRLSQTFAALAVTNGAATEVIETLDLDTTPEELLDHVRAEAPLESTLLTITVDDGDPAEAARIADAFADRMVQIDVSDVDEAYAEMLAFVAEDLRATRAQIDATQARIDQPRGARDADAGAGGRARRRGRRRSRRCGPRSPTCSSCRPDAGRPTSCRSSIPRPCRRIPVSPRVALNVILGAVLGLVVGIALAYTRRRLDDTVRTPEELEAIAQCRCSGRSCRCRATRSEA